MFSNRLLALALYLVVSGCAYAQDAAPTLALPQMGAQPGSAPNGMPPPPPRAPVEYTAAIDVHDGVARTTHASVAQIVGGKVGNATASGIAIQSETDRFNGVYVHGKSEYALEDARVDLSGKGLSDFDGIGAGVLVKDGATLTLRNVQITTAGIVSSAAVANDESVLKVYHSTLIAHGGPTPSGYVRRIGPGMMEPPTPLGIVGTARTTLTMGGAKAYYYDTTIIADGWGALSTDAAHGAYVEANRCDIRVLRSGYGAYADNGAQVVINDSKMDTATFAGIIAGQASITFNRVTAVSGGNTVMIHDVMGSPAEVSSLVIRGGKLTSTNAAIVVKSANADIVIDRAELTSMNGDLLLGVPNDDSFATKVNGAKVAGIKATIMNTSLKGNLVHLDKDREMRVALVNTQLSGYVKNVSIALDAKSRWNATSDSSAVLVGAIDVVQIDAPVGVTINAKAGVGSRLKGRFVLASGGVLNVN